MNRFLYLIVITIIACLSSCSTPKVMAYISDAERDSAQRILATYANTIHVGDQLYIYVYSQIPESVIPFNQETHKVVAETSRLNSVRGNEQVNTMNDTYKRKIYNQEEGYLIDDSGFLHFPVLGEIKVEGISYDSLQTLIQQRLINEEYVKDPIVTVSPMNFRVSVVGEVKRPRELHITGDRLTIFEALAMCGDITDSGMRNNVVVLREVKGVVTPIELDLTQKSVFSSDGYYLQQNDLVYVEPDMRKKRRANYNQDFVSYSRFGSGIAHFAFLFYRRFIVDRRSLFH